MKLDIITLFPDMFAALDHGIVGRALKNNLLSMNFWNPRDYTDDPHRSVDDRPYGGGPGMLMKAEPLAQATKAARTAQTEAATTIYLSPQGTTLNQDIIAKLALMPRLVIISGRYEGVDERFITQEVDAEYSVGDYVLSGGELPAMLLIDAMTRLLPTALGHEDSAQQDSFSNGLLDCPHYTRPEHWQGQSAPEILLSGDHQAISRWRKQQSLGKTWQKRPDLLKRRVLTREEQVLLDEFIREATAADN